MKIAVIAANGRSGKVFVEAALAAGHEVYAGVRGEHDFTPSDNLHVVQCDATNLVEVGVLVDGVEAIASFMGHVRNSPANVQTSAMRVLVEAMKQHNQTRIVSVTGTGVRFDGDKIPFYDRLANIGIWTIDRKRVQDGIDHVDVLKKSGLEWTVLRVLKLQNTGPSTFVLKPNGPTKLYVSRSDVAAAVLQVIEQHSFIGQAPILSRK